MEQIFLSVLNSPAILQTCKLTILRNGYSIYEYLGLTQEFVEEIFNITGGVPYLVELALRELCNYKQAHPTEDLASIEGRRNAITKRVNPALKKTDRRMSARNMQGSEDYLLSLVIKAQFEAPINNDYVVTINGRDISLLVWIERLGFYISPVNEDSYPLM